jgi:hypothetical integral membrane protein (TIGR02206 family)
MAASMDSKDGIGQAACLVHAARRSVEWMNSQPFELFGPAHFAALVATLLAGLAFFLLLRSGLKETSKQQVCTAFGILLLMSVVADPVLRWLRYRSLPQLWEVTLPFYLCDVVSIVLAVALIQKKQRWAELGYFWGIAGTTQGLITPTLQFSWHSPEYYAFFLQHGGVPVAALGLVCARGLAPEPGAWWRVVRWSWVYMVGVFLFNKATGAMPFLHLTQETNYGFLNRKPEVASLFDLMGPWPWYLLTLQAIAFSLYFLLDLPFRWRRAHLRN